MGPKVLRDGDILFRLGDARVLGGFFPMSRFYANASNSKFSHTGIVAIEEEGPVVYDTVGTGVARQPFCVWILDNVGNFGVKRLRPEYQDRVPKVLDFCRDVFRRQLPFDYELGLDDSALLLRRNDRKGLSFRRPAPLRARPAGRHGASAGIPALHAWDPVRHPLRTRAPAHLRESGLLPRQRAARHLVVQVPGGGCSAHLQAGLSVHG